MEPNISRSHTRQQLINMYHQLTDSEYHPVCHVSMLLQSSQLQMNPHVYVQLDSCEHAFAKFTVADESPCLCAVGFM